MNIFPNLLSITGEEQIEDGKKVQLETTETKKDDNKYDRVKRAAVTAISAATVKAKLLANQEEDQIRQLAAFLIEKQVNLITKEALILLLIVDFGSFDFMYGVSICCSCISWKPS